MNPRRRIVFWLAALLLLPGCGRKAPLVAPPSAAPEPVRDLRFELTGSHITLEWSYPRRLVNGDRLEEIEHFLVFRAVESADRDCPSCPLSFEVRAKVAGGPVPAEGPLPRAGFIDRDSRPGHRYYYKVVANAGRRRLSKDSNVVPITID